MIVFMIENFKFGTHTGYSRLETCKTLQKTTSSTHPDRCEQQHVQRQEWKSETAPNVLCNQWKLSPLESPGLHLLLQGVNTQDEWQKTTETKAAMALLKLHHIGPCTLYTGELRKTEARHALWPSVANNWTAVVPVLPRYSNTMPRRKAKH